MNLSRNISIVIIGIFFSITISCAKPSFVRKARYNLDDYGIVFGRLEVLLDKKNMSPDMIFLCQFTLNEGGNCSKINSVIRIERADGYFFAELPPVKYSIMMLMDSKSRNRTIVRDSTALIEVSPKKATYIGTIQVIENYVKTYYYRSNDSPYMDAILGGLAYNLSGGNPNFLLWQSSGGVTRITKDKYMKLDPKERSGYTEKRVKMKGIGFKVQNESKEAKKIFTSIYPNHPEPIEKLAEPVDGK